MQSLQQNEDLGNCTALGSPQLCPGTELKALGQLNGSSPELQSGMLHQGFSSCHAFLPRLLALPSRPPFFATPPALVLPVGAPAPLLMRPFLLAPFIFMRWRSSRAALSNLPIARPTSTMSSAFFRRMWSTSLLWEVRSPPSCRVAMGYMAQGW